jgi:hypothetical protein
MRFETDLRRIPLIARAGFPVRWSTPGEQMTDGARSRRIAGSDFSWLLGQTYRGAPTIG